ncbi:MAG: SMP-30/gluconolactonase/LRE family protein [Planctomycetales bacterium]|nr:SMP-30/gluconolactonase/LRE family protein [Planctomycetales bacterium]
MKRRICTTGLTLILLFPVAALGAEKEADDGGLKIEGIVAFTEGPAWHPTGNVYFTDIVNNRIMRRDANGELHAYRVDSGRANGLLFDLHGRLLACEGGGPGGNRRVTRTELNGTVTVLADNFDGKRFNSPNDLAIDSRGRIYFSDPRYGSRSDLEQFDKQGRAIEGVYRIDADGAITRVIAHEVDRPNGLCVSADDKHLFVADNVNDGPENGVGGARKLWRFDLQPDGSVDAKSRALLFDWGTDRGPDGLAIDAQGRIYAAAGFNFPNLPAETAGRHKAGIYVISPTGEGLLKFYSVPEDMITNCTFGDDDLKTLYVTAGHKLWSIRVDVPGRPAWPTGKSKGR